MATFWLREEEYQYYFAERRTKTSRPPPQPLHKKLAHDGDLRRYKNIFDHNLFFESSVNYPAAASVGEARATTIDSKEAAERYGGISIIDYWTKKPATVAEFRFRN